MNVHVYDTHVTATDGLYYHFDVIVDDANTNHVDKYVAAYLTSINVDEKSVNKSSCSFCHREPASPQMIEDIRNNGHHILPMEGCPKN